ncbi:MAG: sulfotransferase [Myxococcales bacterium]|nr:sulfotransferase [Myxococcales bacterium]
MKARRFFEAVYRDNELRRAHNRRRLLHDLTLYAQNRALEPVDALLRSKHGRADVPVVFIVGAPRSGTTVLYQLVAEHLDVGFVNNRMARYFAAPVLGAMLHGRSGGGHQLALSSEYGRTGGDRSPHEFSWFWHYYGDFRLHDDLSDEELSGIDWQPVKRALEGLAGYFERPLVLKNINFVSYQVAWLKRLLPAAKFIWIRRDDRYTVQSILRVRENEYGDQRVWWSVRPRDVNAWRDKSPVEQVAHQIHDIGRAIETAFGALPSEDRLTLEYEELMEEPPGTLQRVARFIGAEVADRARLNAVTLEPRNHKTVDDETWTQIQTAIER